MVTSGEPFSPNKKQAVVAGQLGSSQKVMVVLDSGATYNFIGEGVVDSRRLKTRNGTVFLEGLLS